jgi:hypothetical protein
MRSPPCGVGGVGGAAAEGPFPAPGEPAAARTQRQAAGHRPAMPHRHAMPRGRSLQPHPLLPPPPGGAPCSPTPSCRPPPKGAPVCRMAPHGRRGDAPRAAALRGARGEPALRRLRGERAAAAPLAPPAAAPARRPWPGPHGHAPAGRPRWVRSAAPRPPGRGARAAARHIAQTAAPGARGRAAVSAGVTRPNSRVFTARCAPVAARCVCRAPPPSRGHPRGCPPPYAPYASHPRPGGCYRANRGVLAVGRLGLLPLTTAPPGP